MSENPRGEAHPGYCPTIILRERTAPSSERRTSMRGPVYWAVSRMPLSEKVSTAPVD